MHTLYALRYGDLYYGDPIGGIDFNDDEPPDYLDFAYLAFTIGMTFQVSRHEPRSRSRCAGCAIRHALLSFLFVAVIGALAINSVASLLQLSPSPSGPLGLPSGGLWFKVGRSGPCC